VSRQLLLLRHARTGHNVARRFQGQADVPLDEVGRAQALRVAPVIAARRPVVIVSSDSIRAADTAAAIGAVSGLPVTLEPALREIDVGGWSGLTLDEVKATFPEEYDAWHAGEESLRRGGGETYAEVGERAYAALSPLLDGPSTELIVAVTHGGTARSLIDLMIGLPLGFRRVLGGLPNVAWSKLDKGRFGWRLVEHGVTVDLGVPPVP
jgi:probable phosphoglycerate mutase